MKKSPKKVVFFQTENTNPYENIAFEYRLLQACPDDSVAVFLWQNDHSIIIGKNQNAWNEVRVAEFLSDGGKIVRRFTGGGAVYHDLKNLNFSFVAPKGIYDKSTNFQVIIRALARLGITAELTGRNDIVVDGKKISGNAFKNESHASLHHGTILINSSVDKMQKYLTVNKDKLASKGVKSVASRVMNLVEKKPDITAMEISQAIRQVCTEVFGAPCVDGNPQDFAWSGEEETCKLLSSKEWIFGRVTDEDFCLASKRFDWGSVEVAFKSKEDAICDLLVFTDSLDENVSQLAIEVLTGMTREQLSSESFANPQVMDIARLIAENF